jgi:hypothetical protein
MACIPRDTLEKLRWSADIFLNIEKFITIITFIVTSSVATTVVIANTGM